jgi:hypothetical protein
MSFTNLTSAEMANQAVRKLYVALCPQKAKTLQGRGRRVFVIFIGLAVLLST